MCLVLEPLYGLGCHPNTTYLSCAVHLLNLFFRPYLALIYFTLQVLPPAGLVIEMFVSIKLLFCVILNQINYIHMLDKLLLIFKL